MTEPLHAYVVGMQWSGGSGSLVRIIAHQPEQATAMAGVVAMRSDPRPEGDLVAVMVNEIPLDWLRWAVRSIEAGKVESASIVQLKPMPWGPNSPDSDPASPDYEPPAA
jgi:hypothetical protein